MAAAGPPRSSGGPTEDPSALARLTGKVVARVEPAVQRVLGIPRVAAAHAVWTRYTNADGPLLARGLAFAALFALVPAILVIVSVAGFIAGNPNVRERIVAILSEQLPPLAPFIDETLGAASGVAATTGLVGLAILAWSATSVVRALDGAFRVVFEDDGRGRTPLRDVIGAVSVTVGMAAAAAILVLVSFPDPLTSQFGVVLGGARSLVAAIPVVLLVGLVYRFVPRPRPRLATLFLPAVVVGLAVFGLTSLFAILAPLVFGSAQIYGAFGALFLGLVWLAEVTQLLLLGAAWVAERADRDRTAAAPRGDTPGL